MQSLGIVTILLVSKKKKKKSLNVTIPAFCTLILIYWSLFVSFPLS